MTGYGKMALRELASEDVLHCIALVQIFEMVGFDISVVKP
jgi:hypothetical protein